MRIQLCIYAGTKQMHSSSPPNGHSKNGIAVLTEGMSFHLYEWNKWCWDWGMMKGKYSGCTTSNHIWLVSGTGMRPRSLLSIFWYKEGLQYGSPQETFLRNLVQVEITGDYQPLLPMYARIHFVILFQCKLILVQHH